MKLNIGSGGCTMLEGYLNIDNLSDTYDTKMSMMKEVVNTMVGEEYDDGHYPHTAFMYVKDANDLSMFEDNSFDEVWSNQCVGVYVTNYDEILRVLKVGGKIKLGVWSHAIQNVVGNLIKRGVKITSVKGFNGPYEETIVEDCNVDDDDYYTVMIEGVLMDDLEECYY